jgi:hypothetical protein
MLLGSFADVERGYGQKRCGGGLEIKRKYREGVCYIFDSIVNLVDINLNFFSNNLHHSSSP